MQMLHTRTTTAIAFILALALPASAQQDGSRTDGRLTVRETPTDEAAVAATREAFQDRLGAEAAKMGRYVEAIRDAQEALERCTGTASTNAATAGPVTTLMDCFVDQAATNERILIEWAGSLEIVEGILMDSADAYDRLAASKDEEIDMVREDLGRLDDERAELRRRLARVRAFLEANEGRLEGEAQHEAIRLRMEWEQSERREAHMRNMATAMRTAKDAFATVSSQLTARAREADLQALAFTYRAEEERFYVAEVSEAALIDIALTEVAGMQAGMGRMADGLEAARRALDDAHADRPKPAPTQQPETGDSFLENVEAASELEAWILDFDEGEFEIGAGQ